MKRLLLSLCTVLFFLNETISQPVVDFSVNSDTICLGDIASFSDLTNCTGCTIIDWVWDFADGSTANASNPSHVFPAVGVYDVQLIVFDDIGGSDTAWKPITVLPCATNIIVDNTDPCCPILIAPQGFTAYLWSTGQVTSTIQACAAGIYTVELIDFNGNSFTQSVVVAIPGSQPEIVLDSITDINCLQNNDVGSIITHIQSGTPPFSLQWNGNPSTLSFLDSITQSGTYNLTVTDANGCSDSEDFTLQNTSNLYVSTNSVPANCGDNGMAWATAQSLNPPYTYQWDDPNNQTTDTAVGLGPGWHNVTVTDNIGCTFTAAVLVGNGCFNMIEGRVYADTNQNCIVDAGEVGIGNVVVYTAGAYTITDSQGYYNLATQQMNPSVWISNINALMFPTCPTNGVLNVSFGQLGDTSSANNFGYYADLSAFDLAVSPISGNAPPGFDKRYWVQYRNNSFQTMDVTIRFEYDPVLTFLSTTMGGVHDAQNHSIEWDFTGVAPSTSFTTYGNSPQVEFNVPTSVQLGDIVCGHFEILPIQGDAVPLNNTHDLCQVVTGSYDPNDKQVNPLGIGEEGFILPEDTMFNYTIRFQNTGTDTAFTVVIEDTLSALLNPATFVPGSSSHHYTVSMSGNGLVKFRFDEIFLPDSNVNEPASHGFVNYTIKADADLPLGSVIENTAAIYFDFNEPVITNTTVNTIHDPLKVEQIVDDSEFEIYPNPTNNMVNLISTKPLLQVWLTDLTGRRVIPLQGAGAFWQADLSALPRGMYLVEAFTKDGAKAARKVLKL